MLVCRSWSTASLAGRRETWGLLYYNRFRLAGISRVSPCVAFGVVRTATECANGGLSDARSAKASIPSRRPNDRMEVGRLFGYDAYGERHGSDSTHRTGRRQLVDLVRELGPGDEIVLTDGGRRLARIVPEVPPRDGRRPGACKGMLEVLDNGDDAVLEHFKEYLP